MDAFEKIIAALITVPVVCIGLLIRDMYLAEQVRNACAKKCTPYVSKIIDDQCHCKRAKSWQVK